MKSVIPALALLAALPAAATVTVSFPSPTYTDIGRTAREADDVKNELARHLHSLDGRYLKAGENLWIEVLDVDLAGELQYQGAKEYRVARGKSDIPMIKVRYSLERGGKTTTGEDTLLSPTYIESSSRITSSEPLHHEKLLLDGWFKSRFAP